MIIPTEEQVEKMNRLNDLVEVIDQSFRDLDVLLADNAKIKTDRYMYNKYKIEEVITYLYRMRNTYILTLS